MLWTRKSHEQKNNIVLLVEDNADDELLTLRALQNNHIANEIVVARNGQEALDYIFAQGEYAHRSVDVLPQVVLLDLKLPKVDGLELLQRIRADARTASLPVVILTSSLHDQDLINSYRQGANRYVRKPVDFKEFMEAANQLGRYWPLLNEVPTK